MNIFEYKISKEEYIKKLEIKLKGFRFIKLMFYIAKIFSVISGIHLILIFGIFNRISLYMILIIIFIFLATNKKCLIICRFLGYNIREKRHALVRRIEWDKDGFKIYNNKKLIINSYNDIKNIIESDKFLILNYEFKSKKNYNIIIPKDELDKAGMYEDLKESVINNIGEDKYKDLDVKFFDISNINIGTKEYALVLLLVVIVIAIIILFLSIVI